MAKVKAFVRVGRRDSDRALFLAVTREATSVPLKDGANRYIPTVGVMLNLDIPDEAFKAPVVEASINVPVDRIVACVKVEKPLVQVAPAAVQG